MNKRDIAIDKQIRDFAKKQEINTSRSYNNRILLAINEGKKHDLPKRKEYIYRKVAIACVCACILTVSGVGVHAAMNYAQSRMEQISDTEKEHYLETLNESTASADSFSRKLTEQEKNRMDELAEDYKMKGVYPNQEMLEISDTNEIISSRICFMPSSSTFYLPESTLTDEDLLELIDFYNIRDNALNSQQKQEAYNTNELEKITQENAVEAAKNMLVVLFDADINHLDTQIDYQQSTDGVEAFSSDYIFFVNNSTGEKYSVAVDLQKGMVGSIEKTNDSENYSNNMQPDETMYKDRYVEAEQMATRFLNNNETWKSSKIIYATSNDGMVKNGIVNYDFIAQNGESCIISYSQAAQQFYQVRHFSEEGILEKERANDTFQESTKKTIVIN